MSQTVANSSSIIILLFTRQFFYLGMAIIGLMLLFSNRQIHKIRFGLILILMLWAEHCLVLAWGRLSLDFVPILGIIFGLGIDTWLRRNHISV